MPVNLTVPTSWNQLSQKQLQNIAYQMECFQEIVKDTPAAIHETSVRLFTQISKELLSGNKKEEVKTALREIMPKEYTGISKFIYDGIARTKFPESVKVGRQLYYGPDIRFRNSSIAEFSFADAVFYKWRQTHEDIWLNVLCAALYREADTNPSESDRRKPFVKGFSVDTRADVFQKLPIKTKLAIAYTYEGCRNHIANTFPNIFPKKIVDEETKEREVPKQKYVSFGEIILDKIEGDPSKLAITNNVLTYDFLAIYEKDIKDLRKAK